MIADQLRDHLHDLLCERFSQQPRPKEYADEASHDDAAGIFIDELAEAVMQQFYDRLSSRDQQIALEAQVEILRRCKQSADQTFGNVKQDIYVWLDESERELATLTQPQKGADSDAS